MSVTEAETVGDLIQKMIVSMCGEQKPGEVKHCTRYIQFFFCLQYYIYQLLINNKLQKLSGDSCVFPLVYYPPLKA